MASRVLYVDDDHNLCQIVAKALQGEGYSVRMAHDGDQGIAMVRDDPPDLLLLDILLPKRDGFDVLGELRSQPGPGAEVPTVLLSGCTLTPAYAKRAEELGAAELLAKPVPLEVLLEAVRRHAGESKEPAPAVKGPKRSRDATRISGSFEKVPFPAVLHHLHGLRATGVLHLTQAKKRKWIQLRDGYPAAVRSNLVKETLGHLLIRTGRIDRSDLEASRTEMEREMGRRQGEILVAMELLSDEDLAVALSQQAEEKLFEVFGWDTGTFRFERGGVLQRASALGGARSPANTILQGVRSRFSIDRIDRYLSTHRQRLVVHGESPFYRFQEIHLDPYQAGILRGLDGSQKLGDFLEEDEDLRRTVYGLLASGLLELRNGGTGKPRKVSAPAPARASAIELPEGAVAAAAAEARSGSKNERAEDARALELATMAEQLRARDYFEILGVERTDGDETIRRAYELVSASAHPDHFSSASRAVRELAGEIFRQLTRAYETLSEPRARQQYLLDLKQEAREEQERQSTDRALQAETEFRKGEEALERRDYETALLCFGLALQLYPDEGDHHAHYGWALHLCHPGDPSMVGEALEHVKRGLKLASHREKPYLFMGRLYKAIGRVRAAEKMFTRAAHIAPECVDALRELRLINMRREKSKGLIGRILRR